MLVHPIKCGFLARMSTCSLLSSQINFFYAYRSLCSSSAITNRRVCVFPASGQISSLRQFHKAVVENAPESVTKEMLSDHFSNYGPLLSAEWVQNADKPEFHVVFNDKKKFDIELYSSSHEIGNKPVYIRPFEAVRVAVHYLSPSTTEDSLHAYFSGFGKVIRCDVIVKKGRTPQGVVNIYYDSDKAKEFCSAQHVIDGKNVKARLFISTELKHYVSNLSPSTTTESLTKFYSQFGEPVEVEIHSNKDRNLHYGLVHFSSQQQVDKFIRSLPHVVDGNEVVFEHNTKDFTLFAAQLPPNSTQEDLKQYFEKFGPVSNCLVVSNKSSGDSAWVTFSSKQGLNLALADRPHSIDGEEIEVYPNDKKAAQKCCLYFSHITPTTTNQMLYDCFSKFGSVVNVNIYHKMKGGSPRPYGYVTFTSADEAYKLLISGPHVVDGEEIKLDVRND